MELEVAVELRCYLELLDRGLADTLALVTADLGALSLVLGSLSGDALVLESPGSQLIPLAELIGAGEAAPLESLV